MSFIRSCSPIGLVLLAFLCGCAHPLLALKSASDSRIDLLESDLTRTNLAKNSEIEASETRRTPAAERVADSRPAEPDPKHWPNSQPSTQPAVRGITWGEEPLSLEAIERVLNSPDSSIPPEYKQHVRDQLIAIATAGSSESIPSARQPSPKFESQRASRVADLGVPTSIANPPVSLPGPVAPIVEPAPRVSSALGQRTPAPRLLPESAAVQPASYNTSAPAPVVSESSSAAVSTSERSEPNATSTIDAVTSANKPTANSFKRGEWRDRVGDALAAIQRERERDDLSVHEREVLEASTRLLHVIANDHDQAVAPREELDEHEREFWKHQLLALVIALDADDKHAGSRWAALVLRELRAATDHLSNVSALDVRNLAFCEKVESFGNYTRFNSTTFKPGKELLLYVEIDNFAVEQIGDEFQTELQAEYWIVDANGKRFNRKLPLVREDCRNRRHDYFIAYHLVLPDDLAAGKYTLELIVEDVKGKKSSQSSIDFNVR